MDVFDPDFWSMLTDPEKYRAVIETLGPWAPALAIGSVIAISFLPLPMQAAAVANGIVFGHVAGFLFTWIGAVAAAFLAFWIARLLGRPVINRFVPATALLRFQRAVDHRGTAFLLLARLVPIIPFTVVNYGSGMSPVRWSTYAVTSVIGLAPPVFVFTCLGALMETAPALAWAALVAIIALLSLIGYYKRAWLLAPPRTDDAPSQ
ncbi:MAG: TVP38/TMEM64 family protein [Pseudomonadota bacterium]